MFELWDDFSYRKTMCVGAGISGGGPRGRRRALDPRGQVVWPPGVFSVPIILK